MIRRAAQNQSWFIYLLVDPRDQQVRYVGKSVNVEARLEMHLQEALDGGQTYKCNWLRSLISQGLVPSVRVVDQGGGTSWIESECFYIKFFREEVGCKLTNATDGGEGRSGWHHTDESREKCASRRGCKLTEAIKQKLREARARQAPIVISLESRKQAADKLRGRARPDMIGNQRTKGIKLSEGHKMKIRESLIGVDNFGPDRNGKTAEERSKKARRAAQARWRKL